MHPCKLVNADAEPFDCGHKMGRLGSAEVSVKGKIFKEEWTRHSFADIVAVTAHTDCSCSSTASHKGVCTTAHMHKLGCDHDHDRYYTSIYAI